MGASSQIINEDFHSKSVVPLYFETLQSPNLSSSIGILNRECVVRPPDNIEATTPEVAVTRAMFPIDLMVASRARYKNVFPVPPGPYMKKISPSFQ